VEISFHIKAHLKKQLFVHIIRAFKQAKYVQKAFFFSCSRKDVFRNLAAKLGAFWHASHFKKNGYCKCH
jgi:hypothetical protein